jgi:hypothetical protein
VLGEVFLVTAILGGKDKDKTGDSTGGAVGWGYWASTYFVEQVLFARYSASWVCLRLYSQGLENCQFQLCHIVEVFKIKFLI